MLQTTLNLGDFHGRGTGFVVVSHPVYGGEAAPSVGDDLGPDQKMLNLGQFPQVFQSTLCHMSIEGNAQPAAQRVSPYCYDPTCNPCNELRDAHACVSMERPEISGSA
jgi:hypothetical protein